MGTDLLNVKEGIYIAFSFSETTLFVLHIIFYKLIKFISCYSYIQFIQYRSEGLAFIVATDPLPWFLFFASAVAQVSISGFPYLQLSSKLQVYLRRS
jgi:hypothetical protein